MAAPTIIRPATAINYGGTLTATAPLLRGALAPASYQFDGCTLPNPSASNLYGYRVTLTAPVNIFARKWITFTLVFNNGAGNSFNALPNGLSILFIDSSGNWSRFPLFYSADNSGTRFRNWYSVLSANEGYFTGFANNTDERQIEYSIALDATPIETSGVLDWATYSHYEVHIGRSTGAVTSQLFTVNRMAAIDTPVISGGDITTPMKESRAVALFTATGTSAPYNNYRNGRLTSGMYSFNQESSPYAWTHPHEISAYYVDSKVAILFRPSYISALDQYPSIQDSVATRRFRKWSGFVSLSDFLISGALRDGGDYDLFITGTDTVTLTNGTIFNAGIADFNHGTFDGVTFKKCGEVVFSAAATYTNCQLAGNSWAGSKGLAITASSGDYSAADFYFADNTGGHDIEITPLDNNNPFIFTGVSVKVGQSLKIHNTTATPITIKLQTGITTALSGVGTITIETPVVLATASISGLIAGSNVRIYNVTAATELHNAIIAGTSYSNNYVEGTSYTSGDIISIRVAWMSGTTAKLPAEYLTVATVNGWSVLANQVDDAVYNYNTIDGNSVTEFADDYPNVQVDISAPDGATTVQRAYAWYIAGQMTANGIRYYHGALTAEDEVNYRINTAIVNLHAQNLNVNPVYVTGGNLYRDDNTSYAVSGGGGIISWYGRAYTVQTVGSPVITGDIATVMSAVNAIPTNTLLTNDIRLDNLNAAISSRLASTDYVATDLSNIPSSVWQYATAVGLTTNVEFIKSIETGRWKIMNNQMIFYAADAVTPLLTFNLKDASGVATMENPMERVPI